MRSGNDSSACESLDRSFSKNLMRMHNVIRESKRSGLLNQGYDDVLSKKALSYFGLRFEAVKDRGLCVDVLPKGRSAALAEYIPLALRCSPHLRRQVTGT